MKDLYYSHLAIPIQKPEFSIKELEGSNRDFNFDKMNRFTDYDIKENNSMLTKDDQDVWYLITSFRCESLDDLKLTRQIFRPSYLKEEKLPLIDRMESLGVSPLDEGFDKAYGHALYFTSTIKNASNYLQLRIANYDGSDDPVICNEIHFVTNHFKNRLTRFVTGFETRSFATITENKEYAEEIHLPVNATAYLKFYLYFSRYGFVPSYQMMPRFLENLWASGQSRNNMFNPSLLEKESI